MIKSLIIYKLDKNDSDSYDAIFNLIAKHEKF